jgi:hypothetical protein
MINLNLANAIASLALCPPAVKTCQFTYHAGMTLRDERGRSRPATLDEIEQDYGQAFVDAAMEHRGQWVRLDGDPREQFAAEDDLQRMCETDR